MKLVDTEGARRSVKDGELVLERGQVLSPSARKFLQNQRILVRRQSLAPQGVKPEEMTHLDGKTLVKKDHPRIRFRGKMDRVQAEVVVAQVLLGQKEENVAILNDLQEILNLLRQITRSEVLDEKLTISTILGMDLAQLREKSHDPKKFFGVESMTLPDWRMGLPYALVNRLRTEVRELESLGVQGFGGNPTEAQREILRVLNRLSSTLHIMMCKILAGQYG